jgi:phospholipase C
MRPPAVLATLALALVVAAPAGAAPFTRRHERTPSGMIQHVVIVIQENRTVDDLYNGFCIAGGVVCADTVTTDPVSGTPLQPVSIAAPFGLDHAHSTFVTQYDDGAMDGFPHTPIHCKNKKLRASCGTAFAYAPAAETPLYRRMATVDGVLSDATFEADQGPSFPAHLYAIAGQSGGYDADNWAIEGGAGNCVTKKPVAQILMTSPYPGETGNRVKPCKDFETIFDLVKAANHTWRYYSNDEGGFWSATQAIQHLYNSPNFILPSTKFLSDVQNGKLADVSFVIPFSSKASDHPSEMTNPFGGQQWVGSVLDAIGLSPYWANTAVVVYWDDWGGFFDHVPPPAAPFDQDPFEYGFRVPLVLISPYARVGTIDHTPRTFISTLRLIEEVFSLPSLGTLDQLEPDGLDSMFDFNQTPNQYVTLLTSTRHQPVRAGSRHSDVSHVNQ